MNFLQIQNLDDKLLETKYYKADLTMYDKKVLPNGANYYKRFSNTLKNTLRTIEPDGLEDKKNNPILKYKDKSIFSIRRFEKEGNRYHVTIYCFKMGDVLYYERFVLYTSTSEGLFWRFCGLRDDGGYDKGFNYVTTTFINMDLQLFLFHSMQYFNIIEKKMGPIDCIPFEKLSNELLIERLTSKYKRMDKDPVFTLLDNIFPYDTMNSKQFYNNQIKFLLNLNKLGMRNFINGYEKNATEKLLKRLIKNDCLKFRDSEESRREFYKRWYKSLTEFFLHFFELERDGATTLIPNRTIHFEDKFKSVNINMSVNRIFAENKHTKKKYIIYYIKYKTSLEQDKNKTYRHILNIALFDANLTMHGIDNNYVSCGMFVNKIFDYYKQINITRTAKERGNMSYTFVGDVFNVPQLP